MKKEDICPDLSRVANIVGIQPFNVSTEWQRSINNSLESSRNRRVLEDTGIIHFFIGLKKSKLAKSFLYTPPEPPFSPIAVDVGQEDEIGIVWGPKNKSATIFFNVKYDNKQSFKDRLFNHSGIFNEFSVRGISLTILDNNELGLVMKCYTIPSNYHSHPLYDNLLENFRRITFSQDLLTNEINPSESDLGRISYDKGKSVILTERTDVPQIIGDYIANNLT